MSSESIDTLTIVGGPLGPIKPCAVTLRPFTVFIGKQGTGKSLLSQVFYFFDNLPLLAHHAQASLSRDQDSKRASAEDIARSVLDNLRSSGRTLAAFSDPPATLYGSAAGKGRRGASAMTLGIGPPAGPPVKGRFGPPKGVREYIYRPNRALTARIREVLGAAAPLPSALFVPAERLLYSQSSSASTWQLLSLPATLVLFADAMERVNKLQSSWPGGIPDTKEGQWIRDLARRALAGEARREDEHWRWHLAERSTRSLPIDMASSGQRANWPLVVLAEALFSWRRSGQIADPFTLYVEEPEIHLHPEAQVAMVKVLAYLVNHGFRVVVTTHSLTVLYALNNLVLASGLGKQSMGGTPEPEVRIKPDRVAAYALQPDGSIKDVVESSTGFLSEVELGQVSASLGDEMNRIALQRDRKGRR